MPSIPTWLARRYHWILPLLVIAVLAPSYWIALHTPATGIYHDDSIYLITARTLAEGRGYWIESIPTPIAQTKYPILFPALLAIVWKLAPAFPANLIYFKLIPLLAALIWFWISYLLLKQESGNRFFAITAIALAAASPQVIFLSTSVLSETLFAALATGSLLLLIRCTRTESTSLLVGAAILAAAAYHTRTIGFCLILGGFVALAWQRKFRRALLFGSICALLSSPWIIWQYLHRSAPDSYLSQENYYSAYNIIFNFAWNEKLLIARTNLIALPFSAAALFDLKWGEFIGLICLPFSVRALFRPGLPVPVRCFLLFSGGVILLWVWPPLRFVVPLLPLILWAVWSGFPLAARKVLLASAWLLFLNAAWSSHAFSEKALLSGLWYPAATESHLWQEFTRQLDWIKTNTAPEAVLQANVDPLIYLYANRHAVRGSQGNATLAWYLDTQQALGSAAEFHANLTRNRVGYIVTTPWTWFLQPPMFERLIEENRVAHPAEFQVRLQGSFSGFTIYQFLPARAAD